MLAAEAATIKLLILILKRMYVDLVDQKNE